MGRTTIKGFPTNVEIDSRSSLKEVERLMLRVSESRNLSGNDEDMLMETYKDARRQWLDDRYELTDSHLKALRTADNRIATAAKDTIDIVCHTLERETSLPEGERMITRANIHLEEMGLPLGIKSVHEMTEEESDLWSLLFSENNREEGVRWGFPLASYNVVSPDNYENWRSRCQKNLEKTSDHGLTPLFWQVRDRYNVALSDMARIRDFYLTVDYSL